MIEMEQLPESCIDWFASLDMKGQESVADYLKGIRDQFVTGGLKAVVNWDLYLSLDAEKLSVSPLVILNLEDRVLRLANRELKVQSQ